MMGGRPHVVSTIYPATRRASGCQILMSQASLHYGVGGDDDDDVCVWCLLGGGRQLGDLVGFGLRLS